MITFRQVTNWKGPGGGSKAQLPEAEIQDLIVELRSATSGVGTYTARFHHLAELTGKLADNVLAANKAAAE
jgi:elongation factor G